MPYDAVVIGAGVNGLAAALHLAAKGWKVIVVERADVAGGAVKTREITVPGFRHDLYAMNVGLFAGSPFFATHKDRLLAQGLAFVSADRCFATAFPDGTWLGVEKNFESNVEQDCGFKPKRCRAVARHDRCLRTGRAACLRPARLAATIMAGASCCVRGLASPRNRMGCRHGASSHVVAERMARRKLRESKAQSHDGGLGHAS